MTLSDQIGGVNRMSTSNSLFAHPCARCGETVQLLRDPFPNVHWDHMSSTNRIKFSIGLSDDPHVLNALQASSNGRVWLDQMLSEVRRRSHEDWHLTNDMSGHWSRTVAVLQSESEAWRNARQAILELWPIARTEIDAQEGVFLTLTAGLGLLHQLSDGGFSLSAEMDFLKAVATISHRDEAIPASVVLYADQSGESGKQKLRTAAQRNVLYLNGLAESALSALALLFTLVPQDVGGILLNLMVDDIDRATGRDRRYCTLSVQVTRAEFEALDLRRVEPVACLKSLKAVVPSSRTEVVPVRPIVEFDKTDRRIVEADDLVSVLGSRPNLMELTPTEFETLIQNLFSAIGLDTHQTQASRDGGVDCIAYDSRPIFGGKIIIQAKRYRNVVGVSAVRDLYGTVMNEGASKGILVTTSHYGKAAYEFAKDKPLELLEGPHLLHLLKEHTGLDARILAPDDWVEPVFEQ